MPKEDLPKIFAIVLNYNGSETLLDCIGSLYNCSYSNLEIIVIDNASTDGSLEKAKSLYGKITYIKNSKNIGFSAGNNIGIRLALEKFADYIFLLNNDANVEKDCILNLSIFAQKNKKVGIISPLIINQNNSSIWFSGGKISWLKMRCTHNKDSNDKITLKTEYVSGCAMLIKKSVFKKIGLFDEDYFLYYEDADFSIRAIRNGFEILIDQSSKVFHHEHSNEKNPKKTYWLVLSALIFFKKNSLPFHKIWQFFYLILRKIKNFFDCTFRPNGKSKMTKDAYRDFRKYSK
jgi:GT2 family glycosyltransferase